MRVLIALFVAILVCVAVFVAWAAKGVILLLAVMAIVLAGAMAGLGALGKLLPLPSAMRARMAKREEFDRRYPSRRYRWLFWLGLGMSLWRLWLAQSSGRYAWSDFWAGLVFMALGLIAILVWRIKHPELAREV
ncbi:hypothetical protein ASD69_01270 [Lysobacter sp. Root604]|nr:hypothetical protein ASD69_01270 [Lysobacter sp. Root604]